MMRQQSSFATSFAVMIFACAFVALSASPAAAQTETVIHDFGAPNTIDGSSPASNLIADSHGVLYGATPFGGKIGCGTVYKLAPPSVQGGQWTQHILYSFSCTTVGAFPGTLIRDAQASKFYGIASGYNAYSNVIFELSAPLQPGDPWTRTIIHTFTFAVPYRGVLSLVSNGKGRLYGTTGAGGQYQSGSVFVLTLSDGSWKEEDIYSFPYDGGTYVFPAGLTLDATGTVYGITSYDSTVFSLTPYAGNRVPWVKNTLYTFGNGSGDGVTPEGGLIFDGAGALYGNCLQGGLTGGGTIFKLAPPSAPGGAWTETVLYSFIEGTGDGYYPLGPIAFDGAGSIYGATESGGIESCGDSDNGCGTVFRIDPPSTQGGAWTEGLLYAFQGGNDGNYPQAGVVVVGMTAYGTTYWGGTYDCDGQEPGCGTLYQVTQ